MDDFKDAFRAARASKESSKLTKEQIRALKATKAAEKAKQSVSKDDDGFSIPAPPSQRPTTAPSKNASFHADSQATRINDGSTTAHLNSQPSVNQRMSARNESAANNEPAATRKTASGIGSTPLNVPAGFFQDSTTVAARAAEPSYVGSTGNLEVRGVTGQDQQFMYSAESLKSVNPAMSEAIPGASGDGIGGETVPAQAGTLPKGFFTDAAADARARGTDKPKLSEKQLAEEYTDFMQQIETTGAATAQAVAVEDEEDAEVKDFRDEFEHFVRVERIKELKEAAALKRKRAQKDQDGNVSSEGNNVTTRGVLEAAMISVEADVDVSAALQQHVKGKKGGKGMDALEYGGVSSDDDDDELELDWRAKRSKV